MFPQDVVANAQRIISDLRTFFPPRQDTFVIGPMAKIGWGTPTLASLSLGIVIEIPGNIAILGVLRVALPADEAALIVLQVNFLGAIEFDKKRFYFFAAIYDSRILFLTIEGEMAVAAAFGDDALFVLSVGGFHPDFDPPADARARTEADRRQHRRSRLGADPRRGLLRHHEQHRPVRRARSICGSGSTTSASSGTSPSTPCSSSLRSRFIIAISASVSLRVFGFDVFTIRLAFALSGPSPWRAKGSGSLSLLFFEIEVSFDETFGDKEDASLPDVAVLPLLIAELDKLECWRTTLPSNGVATGQPAPARPARRHAGAAPRRCAPGLPTSGPARPVDHQTRQRQGHRRQARSASRWRAADSRSKATSWSRSRRPSSTTSRTPSSCRASRSNRATAGSTCRPPGRSLRTGPMVQPRRALRGPHDRHRLASGSRHRFQLVLTGSVPVLPAAARRSPGTRSPQYQATLAQPFAEKVAAGAEGFAVASSVDNALVATFLNETMAADHLAAQVAADASLAGTLHVVPAFEAVAA